MPNTERIFEWYEKYKTGLFRYGLSLLKDPEGAEDVLQEVFVRLLSGRYFPEPGKEQAYLYRMARNLCVDHLRRQKRLAQEPPQIPSEQTGYAYIELISPLSQKEQEIVTLKIVGGLTHREIAKVLGLTEHAAKKRYERAIQKLREE